MRNCGRRGARMDLDDQRKTLDQLNRSSKQVSKFRLHVTLFTFVHFRGVIVLTTATIFKIKGKLKLCYFSNMYGGIR